MPKFKEVCHKCNTRNSNNAKTCANCSACLTEPEVWSRTVGFYRPVQNWNKGKKQEYQDRKPFKILEDINGSSRTEKPIIPD